jgi:hypothetical protein
MSGSRHYLLNNISHICSLLVAIADSANLNCDVDNTTFGMFVIIIVVSVIIIIIRIVDVRPSATDTKLTANPSNSWTMLLHHRCRRVMMMMMMMTATLMA